MNCTHFGAWLDAGSPHGEAAAAHAHAAGCARCAAALRAMETVERLAALEPDAPAPPGFADAVMARVAATPQLRAVRRAAAANAFPEHRLAPWWVRLAQQPSVMGSLALAMLLAWQWHALAGSALALLGRWQPAPLDGLAGSEALRVLGEPSVLLTLGVALAVPVTWALVSLFAATARLVSLPARR